MKPLLLACALVVAVRIGRAQTLPLAAWRAVEVQSHARWLEGRQQPRFTPFDSASRWIFVDSVRPAGSESQWFLSFDGRLSNSLATLVVGPEGRVSRITSTQRRQLSRWPPGIDTLQFVRRRLFDVSGRNLDLPEARVWDLVPSFRPARLVRGARWTDTIDLAVDTIGDRQALTGTRVSTLVADTVVDGRRLWIVADSADVRYDERALREERTLDTLVATDRAVNGIVRGRMLYDPAAAFYRVRVDTSVLIGRATLRYPDGRVFEVPARYESTRRWTVYDSSSYAARRHEIDAARQRTYSGGAVIVPTNPVDERLSKGDTALRDSLLRVWRASPDPDERSRLFGRLSHWGGRDRAFVQRLGELRIAEGDSAYWLQTLAGSEYTHHRRPIGGTTMRQLIAIMADPGVPFAFGVSRDIFYEDLAQVLLAAPPAITRDTTQWPCRPDACRMLAEQYAVASEPRLRAVGLVAAFALDPRRWGDTVIAAAARDHTPFLADAALLARGVGATWATSAKAPIPSPEADWHAWMQWMAGTDPSVRPPSPANVPSPAGGTQSMFRLQGSHRVALRVTELRTGRDIIAELRRGSLRATTDTARVVYEYLLFELGEYRPNPDSVAAHFQSPSPLRHTLAQRELESILDDSAPLADSTTSVELENDLISMTLADGRPWRTLDPNGGRMLPMRETAVETTYLLADSVPPALRARWAGRVRLITAAEWKARSDRTGGTLFTLTSVRRLGEFVRLGVSSSGRVARRADQAPWLYYASTTYYLMRLRGEWVIVGADGWIT